MKLSWVAIVLGLGLTVFSCARPSPSDNWLEQARLLNQPGPQTRPQLERLLTAPLPPAWSAQDARWVRKDIHFRLACLDLDAKNPKAALARAEAGLALGQERDLFTANLLIARAQALENLHRDLEAAEAYHQALQINEILLAQALAEPRTKP